MAGNGLHPDRGASDCTLVGACDRGAVLPEDGARGYLRGGRGAGDKDRLYRALDHLLPHKAALEAHLKSRIGTLFDEPFDILLYDLTSTYFEGLGEGILKHVEATAGTTGPTACRW